MFVGLYYLERGMCGDVCNKFKILNHERFRTSPLRTSVIFYHNNILVYAKNSQKATSFDRKLKDIFNHC